MPKPLILIELNEINFDLITDDPRIECYPNLKRLLEGCHVETRSEDQYDLLEPWIQWVSVHTGQTYSEHRIFRLGDIAEADHDQIFETLEGRGFSVGAISPMNAANRMCAPAYFIPDPWTRTPHDGSLIGKILTPALQQAVNDNSEGRLTPRTLLSLVASFASFARPRNWAEYGRLALTSLAKGWRRAIFLDLLLHDIHLRMFRSKRPDFSTLFLNAGAHIQHHYFFNFAPVRGNEAQRNPAWYVRPDDDPVHELLVVYDRIIGDYLSLTGVELIVATGLRQVPYDKTKFYYRLKDHGGFLNQIGVEFKDVLPRMTRDFLVEFTDRASCQSGRIRLEEIKECQSGKPIFDIDDRGQSLYVTLKHSSEITPSTKAAWPGGQVDLHDATVFVAIKNGMHDAIGHAFFSPGLVDKAPQPAEHVSQLHTTILKHFSALE